MAVKFDIRTLPLWAKIIISVLPSVLITVFVVFIMILPKQKEIKGLDRKIVEQENQIAASQIKAAKLEVLMKENEDLINRLEELKRQLPEEKEISGLLKQVSDLGLSSGLEILSWRPGSRQVHPGGIVYEIPVSVQVTSSYHNLGYFLSSLTTLNRIINIKNMKLGSPKIVKDENLLQVTFISATYTAIPEAEAAQIAAQKGK